MSELNEIFEIPLEVKDDVTLAKDDVKDDVKDVKKNLNKERS